MPSEMSAATPKFREAFTKSGWKQQLVSWFPGHMHKGMLQMQKRLLDVDCIIEVHDARIPFSGRNPDFYRKLTAIKPHILVLNKRDLTDHASVEDRIRDKLKAEDKIENVLFTNCKDTNKGNINKILPLAIDLMRKADSITRAMREDCNLMVIGIPNVGKSSIINRLRNLHMGKKNANPVGAKPGITKSVLERVKINDNPTVFLVDTPGIMQPHIKDLDVGMKLALCCTLNDYVVGEELIADYLLYWLNKNGNFSYVPYLGIPSATDNIRLLLMQTAVALNRLKQVKNIHGTFVTVPDVLFAAQHFLKAFREGLFGKLLLDNDIINKS